MQNAELEQNSSRASGISERQAAIIAAVSLFVMFVAAMVAEMAARQSLIVANDAAKTAENILANGALFRIGILGFLVVLVCDILVTWALYVFLERKNRSLSLLSAICRILYTAIFGVAIANLVAGYRLLSSGDRIGQGKMLDVQAQAMQCFQAFDDIWAIALITFGLHVLFLGFIFFKSEALPRVLGIILMVAAVAYLGDNFSKLLMVDYQAFKPIFTAIVAIPAIVGELGLAFWLIFKGGKTRN